MSYLRTRSASGLAEGCALFRRFHRFEPGAVVRERCRRRPDVLVHVGWLRGLIYSSHRGGCGRERHYVHFLDTPARLTCDPAGRQLYILGGNYQVTRRGIEG